jgi:hypothetical protein
MENISQFICGALDNVASDNTDPVAIVGSKEGIESANLITPATIEASQENPAVPVEAVHNQSPQEKSELPQIRLQSEKDYKSQSNCALMDYSWLVGTSFVDTKNECTTEAKIFDKAWSHPFATPLNTIYSAFYKFNLLLKDYDPYPNFPLPCAYANRGAAARAFYTALNQAAQTTPASAWFNTIQAAANNNRQRAFNDNRPLTASNNLPSANNFHPPNVGLPNPTALFTQTHQSPFFGASFPTVAEGARANSFAYLNSPSFYSMPSISTNPYSNTYTSTSPSISPSFSSYSINTNPYSSVTTASSNIFSSPTPSPIFTTLSPIILSPSPALSLPNIIAPLNILSPAPTPDFLPIVDIGVRFEPRQDPAPTPQRFPPDGWVLGPGYIVHHKPTEWQQIHEQRLSGFPPNGWVLGPGYIFHDPQLCQQINERYASDPNSAGDKNEVRLLGPIIRSHEARLQEAREKTQAAQEIAASLKGLCRFFYIHSIWIDESYIRNILSLPIDSIHNLLHNGLAAETLYYRAKAQAARKAQTRSQTASSSGNGGKDCNDPAAQAEFDKIPADLAESEDGDHDGHTRRKHVAQTMQDFLDRFKNEPKRDELSSFPDLETAEKVYQEVLNQAKSKICKWLSQNGNAVKNFYMSFHKHRIRVNER